MKHNKKRNTAFLYEVLLREGTKASLEKNYQRMQIIKDIIVHAFHPETPIGKELYLYNSLLNPNVEQTLYEKYLYEIKNVHLSLDKKEIFNEQTRLINYINKYHGNDVYVNFVPYYKKLATISQIFNNNIPIKEKLLLEQNLLQELNQGNHDNKELKAIDTIVYKTFVNKFNNKYSNLLNEQKELLTKYVSSFADDGLELKVYINEEIDRLKDKINISLTNEEIKNDSTLFQKTNKLLDILNNFSSSKNLTPSMLENILKVQQFVYEVNQ